MNKTCWIHKARCTKAERTAIGLLMHVTGLKYAGALRVLIREGAKQLGVWEPARPLVAEIKQMLKEMSKDDLRTLSGHLDYLTSQEHEQQQVRTLVDTRERYEAEVEP